MGKVGDDCNGVSLKIWSELPCEDNQCQNNLFRGGVPLFGINHSLTNVVNKLLYPIIIFSE